MSIDTQNVADLSSDDRELLAYLLEDTGLDIGDQHRIMPRTHHSDLPLSFAQQRLWFLQHLDPASFAYHIPTVVRLTGALDIAALQHALNLVVARHESLRTVFPHTDLQPVQVILPPQDVPLLLVDLPSQADDVAMQAVIQQAIQQPFDLQHGPLLRALLLRLHHASCPPGAPGTRTEHVLVLILHHIVSDGWSQQILWHELTTFYRGIVQHRPVSVPDLPIQYADYALWQRQWLAEHPQGVAPDGIMEQQRRYWQQQLAGLVPLDLPTDYPRPPTPSFRGARATFRLSSALAEAVQALSTQLGATPFMTLLAAFKVLLYRYSHQTDLAVGTPIAGRMRPELEDLIGCFVNTLVLRTDLSGNPGFVEVVARVRQTALDAYTHQELPFDLIVEAVQSERDLSHHPLVQVMFVLQNMPTSSIDVPQLTLTPVTIEDTTAKFDLTLTILEEHATLCGIVEYSTDLFAASTIARLIQRFQILLAAIVRDPSQRMLDLPLISSAEQAALIQRWNSHRRTFPIHTCLHTYVEEHAARRPHAIAISYGQQQITYGELNARANQLARYLRACGVGPETLVGLQIDRSFEQILGVLGILKAGGAYVPIDPTYPAERIAFLLDDSRIGLLLTQQDLVDRLPNRALKIICLDTDWPGIAAHSADNLIGVSQPEHLAYVIYTSGSTGQPKGSLLTHAHVLRLFAATQNWFHFDHHDVWTLFHSIAFDFSVWELWGALLHGGRLVVVPYLTSRDPAAFARLIRAEQITILNQTPSAFRQLIPADAALDMSLPASRLRRIIFGGEALDPPSLQPWLARSGDQQPTLVNMYGITETTVHVTYRPLRWEDCQPGARSVIGAPILDLALYLLDSNGQPVPPGLPGELYVGGTGVARGYGRRPALTAERFVPDPFSGIPGARLYRTGDLARETADGDIEYLGRIDQQVKLRGFRIELGEIQAALLGHPALADACVLLREDTPGEPRLVAYIVPHAAPAPSTTDLRSFLQTRLPDYMIPAVFVPISAVPLTPHGKIDHRALPIPDRAASSLGAAFVPPSTPEEQALAEIWADVLGVQRVGAHDNFFALGGDSMRSVKLLGLARQRGLSLTIQDIFQHQTLAELARQARLLEEPALDRAPVAPFALIADGDRARLPDTVEDAYPLTTLQHGMIFHSIAHPETGVYHDIVSIHVRAPFDQTHLQTALDQVAADHAILRTAFDLVHYQAPLQLVYRSVQIPLAVIDLRSLSTEAVDAAIDQWRTSERQKPFCWDQPPLLRCQVHRRTDATFEYSVSFHHAILDGWSLASLLTELFQRYVRLVIDPTTPVLPSPGLAFREYVALELRALASEEHAAYWRDKLTASTCIQLPRLPRRDEPTPSSGGVRAWSVPISAETSAGLHALAQQGGVPIKSVLLAAHLRVLALLGGTTDVVTGLVTHGRPHASDGERVLGLFLNTVPFRLQLAGGTWLDLIRQTFAAEGELQPFLHYPMAQMQRLCGGAPLFEILFNFVHFHVYQQITRVPGIEVLDTTMFERTNFPLSANFSLAPDARTIVLQLCCDSPTIAAEQLDRIAGYYQRVLESMAFAPNQAYHVFSPLSAEEHDQLMAWGLSNQRDVAVNEDSMNQLFAAQVQRTPQHLAVISQAGQLTYQELDRRAEAVAHQLRQHRVGPGKVVAVFGERSIPLVVAMLGIWKSGATYLPLDPRLPTARLSYSLRDADATVILTSAALMRDLPPTTIPIIFLDVAQDEISSGDQAPLPVVHPDHLAYVIYTSGSTGEPKGIGISYHALVQHCAGIRDAFALCDQDRVLQFTSPSFDVSIDEIVPTLLSGACVVIPDTELGSPLDFTGMIEAAAITVVNLPPIYWREWVQAVAQRSQAVPASLRLVIVGGDVFPAEMLKLWQSTPLHTVQLLNGYGPTETTITATLFDLATAGDLTAIPQPIPIGRPLAPRSAYILDTSQALVPIGVAGELYLGGPLLARGYLNRPDLTGERFVPDPFNRSPNGQGGARLYRTGDLARWLPDGTIEFLGRIDQQVKVRGYRIELGEIEATLRQHPEVHAVAAIIREDVPGDRRIVVYVVGAQRNKEQGETEIPPRLPQWERGLGGEGLSTSALRRFLEAKLPHYMVPSAFVQLDNLPLTSSGKLNRAALPAPDSSQLTLKSAFVAPRTPIETTLAQIWADVLRIEQIGIHDNFFELGGHSLLTVRVMAEIRQQFGRSLPLATLLQSPTIAQFAMHLEQPVPEAEWSPLVPLRAQGRERPLFLVHPIGGTVFCYVELARLLGLEQPVYGLQARGVEPGQTPYESLTAMVDEYLTAIRRLQPHGPYRLGGWSFGGVVAFEIASQLRRQGETVELLALIDSNASTAEMALPDDATVLTAFLHDLGGMLGTSLGVTQADLAPLTADARLQSMLAQAQQQEDLPLGMDLERLQQLASVFAANLSLLAAYRPAPMPLPVAFLGAEATAERTDLTDAWRALTTVITSELVPGTHYTLLRPPQVQIVATWLGTHLATSPTTP